MNKQLQELYDWLDEPKQLTRQLIKEKIIEIDKSAKTQRKPRSVFTTPSVEEISEYCLSRNNHLDPETFFDFYSAKNWFVGKNKMADWKAAVRTWEKNNTNKSFGSNQTEKPLVGRMTQTTMESNFLKFANVQIPETDE